MKERKKRNEDERYRKKRKITQVRKKRQTEGEEVKERYKQTLFKEHNTITVVTNNPDAKGVSPYPSAPTLAQPQTNQPCYLPTTKSINMIFFMTITIKKRMDYTTADSNNNNGNISSEKTPLHYILKRNEMSKSSLHHK